MYDSIPDFRVALGRLDELLEYLPMLNTEFKGKVDERKRSINSVEETKSEETTDYNICGICLFAPFQVVLVCGHSFCQGCIDDWRTKSKTCPFCRSEHATMPY